MCKKSRVVTQIFPNKLTDKNPIGNEVVSIKNRAFYKKPEAVGLKEQEEGRQVKMYKLHTLSIRRSVSISSPKYTNVVNYLEA